MPLLRRRHPRSIDPPSRRELDSSRETYRRETSYERSQSQEPGDTRLAGWHRLPDLLFGKWSAGADDAALQIRSRLARSRCRNKWKMGGVTGLAVDKDDNVWVYDRPNDMTDIELEGGAHASGCRLLRPAAIDDPHRQERQTSSGPSTRRRGTAWTSTAKGLSTWDRTRSANTIPRPVKWWAKYPRTPEREGGGGGEGRGWRRCRPCSGPRRRWPGGRIPDAARRARAAATSRTRPLAAAAAAAFRAKYPPTTPMIVGGIERNSARRSRQRDLRRRQLPRWTRDGVRPEHVCLQTRLGGRTVTSWRTSP